MLIVAKNVINIYAKPDSNSEVTSQAILGDRLISCEQQASFTNVICEDKYRGWVDTRYLVDEHSNAQLNHHVTALFVGVRKDRSLSAELITRLVISTKVKIEDSSKLEEFVKVYLPGGETGWSKSNDISMPLAIQNYANWGTDPAERAALINMLGERVVATAKRFIGVPYLWGGTTPFGIDCSGLVQLCYKIEGVQLLRDTYLQSGDKRFIEVEQKKPFDKASFEAGDIVVFGTENNHGTGDHNMHIGIACGDGYFIHASGRERNFGVYIDSCREPFYAERYMKALRLSATAELSIESS